MVPQLQQLRLHGLGIILETTSLGGTFHFSSPAIYQVWVCEMGLLMVIFKVF
jgi:hypothetical protein